MYQIGIASRMSGVQIETIRYYEREGIVPRPDRSASGRRIYTKSDVERLRFIRRCRELGLPMSEAKSLLGLTGDRVHNCHSARNIASHHLADVQNKIKELQKMETALQTMILACDSNADHCPILNELLSD